MKVSLLSGAYGNIGDKLIENRCSLLLEHVFGQGSVTVYSRKSIHEYIERINDSDLVAFSGGPIYQKNIGSNFSIQDAMKIEKPLIVIGGGWKGNGRWLNSPYEYTFSSETKELFSRIDSFGGLACRDYYSVKTLTHAGLKNAVMTGCPAWYDLSRVHEKELRDNNWKLKKIFISDPSRRENYRLLKKMITYLHSQYPLSEISLVMHRAVPHDFEDKEIPELNELKYLNIIRLGGERGNIDIYDDCDLHVGFRVHAHIYNLSRRKKTILIEEDGRGAGLSEAIGLPSLLAYNDQILNFDYHKKELFKRSAQKLFDHFIAKENGYIIEQLDWFIDTMQKTNGIYYCNAFSLMEMHFDSMIKFLQKYV